MQGGAEPAKISAANAMLLHKWADEYEAMAYKARWEKFLITVMVQRGTTEPLQAAYVGKLLQLGRSSTKSCNGVGLQII